MAGINKLSFHSQCHTLNYDGISTKFDCKKLVPVDNINYLGMYLDKYLARNAHMDTFFLINPLKCKHMHF